MGLYKLMGGKGGRGMSEIFLETGNSHKLITRST